MLDPFKNLFPLHLQEHRKERQNQKGNNDSFGESGPSSFVGASYTPNLLILILWEQFMYQWVKPNLRLYT